MKRTCPPRRNDEIRMPRSTQAPMASVVTMALPRRTTPSSDSIGTRTLVASRRVTSRDPFCSDSFAPYPWTYREFRIASEDLPGHVLGDGSGSGANPGQAMTEELAFLASSIVDWRRQSRGAHHHPDLFDDSLGPGTQLRVHRYSESPPGGREPEIPERYWEGEHLLQAETLGAELHMRGVPMTPANLVLDRCHVAPLVKLHGICASIETQTFRP